MVEVAGERLDQVLAALPRVGSRARAKRALEGGKVTVDGASVDLGAAGRRLPTGAVVEVDWDRPGSSLARVRGKRKVAAAGIRILHEDPDLVAVDKPVGLLTDTATAQQQRERDSLRKRLTPWLRAAGGRAFIVHRIDRDTSGVVLLARNEEVAERLRAQFRARTPERVYLAVVEGVPSRSEGTWEDPMVWDAPKRIQRRCAPDDPDAFVARAHYRVVEAFSGAALVEVRLETGRRNQIRLQAQLRGHPLIGERLYRSPDQPARVSFPRQALHARKLAVVHPKTGTRVEVEAPLPSDMARLLRSLRR